MKFLRGWKKARDYNINLDKRKYNEFKRKIE